MAKCVFDLVIALLGLIVLLPVLAIVAVLVRWSSPGPAQFRQIRVGRGAGLRPAQVPDDDGPIGQRDGGLRPRGRLARHESRPIPPRDEARRVAPTLERHPRRHGTRRPPSRGPKWVEVNPDCWAIVHAIRPGITDPAAILYRNEEKILANVPDPERLYREEILPRKLDLYVEYVRTRTFWADLKILGQTAIAIIAGAPADPHASGRREVGIAEETQQTVEQHKK